MVTQPIITEKFRSTSEATESQNVKGPEWTLQMTQSLPVYPPVQFLEEATTGPICPQTQCPGASLM